MSLKSKLLDVLERERRILREEQRLCNHYYAVARSGRDPTSPLDTKLEMQNYARKRYKSYEKRLSEFLELEKRFD